MVNTYQKGNRNEKLCRELLQSKGWICWKPSRAKYNPNDIFGLFDFVGVRNTQTLFAQVKSAPSHFYSARKAIAQWCEANKTMVTCLCILYLGNNQWRMEWYDVVTSTWGDYTP